MEVTRMFGMKKKIVYQINILVFALCINSYTFNLTYIWFIIPYKSTRTTRDLYIDNNFRKLDEKIP